MKISIRNKKGVVTAFIFIVAMITLLMGSASVQIKFLDKFSTSVIASTGEQGCQISTRTMNQYNEQINEIEKQVAKEAKSKKKGFWDSAWEGWGGAGLQNAWNTGSWRGGAWNVLKMATGGFIGLGFIYSGTKNAAINTAMDGVLVMNTKMADAMRIERVNCAPDIKRVVEGNAAEVAKKLYDRAAITFYTFAGGHDYPVLDKYLYNLSVDIEEEGTILLDQGCTNYFSTAEGSFSDSETSTHLVWNTYENTTTNREYCFATFDYIDEKIMILTMISTCQYTGPENPACRCFIKEHLSTFDPNNGLPNAEYDNDRSAPLSTNLRWDFAQSVNTQSSTRSPKLYLYKNVNHTITGKAEDYYQGCGAWHGQADPPFADELGYSSDMLTFELDGDYITKAQGYTVRTRLSDDGKKVVMTGSPRAYEGKGGS